MRVGTRTHATNSTVKVAALLVWALTANAGCLHIAIDRLGHGVRADWMPDRAEIGRDGLSVYGPPIYDLVEIVLSPLRVVINLITFRWLWDHFGVPFAGLLDLVLAAISILPGVLYADVFPWPSIDGS